MIYTDQRVPASGPKNAKLMAIGMSPARWEIASKIPFSGPSGKVFDDALATNKISRTSVRVTNLCGFYIDDNDLYSVPEAILLQERARVFAEIEETNPNVLFVMGSQTLTLLQEGYVGPFKSSTQKKASSKWAIGKWRGSIIPLKLSPGRIQKCVVAHHPAGFIRGQWKWLPIFKYIDVPKAVTQSSFPEIKLTPRTSIVGPSFRTVIDYLHEAMDKDTVSFDYEGRKFITCLGIGWSQSEALCIPLNRVGSSFYWGLEEEVEIWKLWCAVLENHKGKIAQNASFEWIKSWLHGIYPSSLFMDTMHAHHCLYPDFGGIVDEWTGKKRDIDNPGHGLAFITSQYTDQIFYKDDGRHWEPSMGEERFWQYNCLDVMVTFEAAQKMEVELKAAGLWQTYCQNYRDTFENSLRMEWNGIKIDIERREEAHRETQDRIRHIGATLSERLGREVITKANGKTKNVLNLASPKQLLAFLTNEKKYKIRLSKKGKPTVDKDTLNELAIKYDDNDIRMMIEMRQLQDLDSEWLTSPLDENGRIHCHNKLGGTNGTRWSSAESILGTGRNLQNLNRQGIVRSLFLPN